MKERIEKMGKKKRVIRKEEKIDKEEYDVKVE